MLTTAQQRRKRKRIGREKAQRRSQAGKEYEAAARRAESADLCLIRLTEAHYQLRGPGWLINLYPGHQRICADRNQRRRAPFLKVPEPWTLGDVVKAATA